ncbi:ATP-binding protein [Leuconostoc mesenteroides]|uniref:ATP-binding protein n=1 Tax=Leuconostoc mesenteroides TaxID=1245 RepID=UPI0021A8E247|nr:AAA family ATPase [Leuconostoc mesenteroides]MCT3045167.1 DNA repair protein [Leuconostoc mesenteroides]
MKIKRLEISGFGRWSQEAFDLSDGLQVIFGQNESGKTTLRAFIVGVLFGFPTKKNGHNVYDPKDGSQYGGSLILETDEGDVKITRLNRTKTTLIITRLINQTEIIDPEKWLKQKLSPLTREAFDDIFNFNQEDLTRISQIKSVDFQKLLLNIGAVGSTGWLDVMAEFDKSADKLFAPRANKRPLNIAIKEYENATEELHQKSAELDDFMLAEQALTDLESEQHEQEEKILTASQQLQETQQLVQQYQLFESAKKIEIENVPSVDEKQVVQARRLQIEIDSLNDNILRHNEALKNIEVPHEVSDDKTDQMVLTKAQVAQRNLAVNTEKRTNLLKQKEQIEAQFEGDVPKGLTDSELQSLSSSNVYLLSTGALILILFVSIFIMHWPALWMVILSLIVTAGLFYKRQKKNQIRQMIQKAYSPLNIQNIKKIQPEVDQYEQQKMDIQSLNEQIEGQYDSLIQMIQPIALKLDIQILSDSLELTIAQLISVQQQESLSEQSKRSMYVQQQNQIVTEIQQQQEKLSEKLNEQKTIFKEYHVTDLHELQNTLDQYNKNEQLKQRYQDIMNQIDESTRQELLKYDNETQLLEQKEKQQKYLTILQKHAFELQSDIAHYKAQQEQRTSNDQFMMLQQDLANQKTELTQQFGEYLAKKMSVKWINQALQDASQNRFPKMQQLATDYFQKLTAGRYVNIQFDKNTLQVVRNDRQKFSVVELSTGTQEQLYVAFRLALSQVIKDIINMPILIDDGFVNFDLSRKQNVIALLTDIGRNQQVIYWTAAIHNEHFDKVIEL